MPAYPTGRINSPAGFPGRAVRILNEPRQRKFNNPADVAVVKPPAQSKHRSDPAQKGIAAVTRDRSGGSHDNFELMISEGNHGANNVAGRGSEQFRLLAMPAAILISPHGAQQPTQTERCIGRPRVGRRAPPRSEYSQSQDCRARCADCGR